MVCIILFVLLFLSIVTYALQPAGDKEWLVAIFRKAYINVDCVVMF